MEARERIIIYRGDVVASDCKNLRGVIDYARVHGVKAWQMAMTDEYGAAVAVWFGDGASAAFRFVAWDVAQRWIRARRSWGLDAASIRPTLERWEKKA